MAAVLSRRLTPAGPAALAVGLSGGSDSLALLLLTKAWADARGRRLVAFTVDHGLQAASAGWAIRCGATCARLGVTHRILTWTGDKPAGGLPAAARAARHRLLADATREAGASVLLLGHTADDLAESAAMRAAGSTVPDARAWAPSPVWPEGRGVFVLRPLLAVRRQTLRDWLAARGEGWIEDPANDDLTFARSRARRALQTPPPSGEVARAARRRGSSAEGAAEPVSAVAGIGGRPPQSPPLAATAPPNRAFGPGGATGYLTLPRSASAGEIAAACLCAAGTARPPRGERLQALMDRLAAGEVFTATLAGARIEASTSGVGIFRETGELSRRGFEPLPLPQNRTVVFDGRFELTATAPGLVALALRGNAARLPEDQRRALKSLPAAARTGLPVVTDGGALWTCPILAVSPFVRAQALVQTRFDAALGRIAGEANAQSVAEHGEAAEGDLS